MTASPDSIYRLSLWEEIVGPLHKVDENKSLALISSYYVLLPSELIRSLKSYVGKRISLLHTDILNRPFLFRVVSDQKTDAKAAYDRIISNIDSRGVPENGWVG